MALQLYLVLANKTACPNLRHSHPGKKPKGVKENEVEESRTRHLTEERPNDLAQMV